MYLVARVVDSIGGAFFATGNADVNTLRTVQDALAAELIIELGIPKDSGIESDLFRQQRSSDEVSFPIFVVCRLVHVIAGARSLVFAD